MDYYSKAYASASNDDDRMFIREAVGQAFDQTGGSEYSRFYMATCAKNFVAEQQLSLETRSFSLDLASDNHFKTARAIIHSQQQPPTAAISGPDSRQTLKEALRGSSLSPQSRDMLRNAKESDTLDQYIASNSSVKARVSRILASKSPSQAISDFMRSISLRFGDNSQTIAHSTHIRV
jgi:hypothetical protein